jgi:hypothetical protein
MLHKRFVLIVALGLVCSSGTSVSAYDLCIQLSGGGGYVALKSPKMQLNCCPPVQGEVNNCVPLNGAEVGGLRGAVTGTGCIDSLGNYFIYHYIYHNDDQPRWSPGLQAYFETGLCRFKLGDFGGKGGRLTGDCRGTVLTNPSPPGGSGAFQAKGTLWACDSPASDVPDGNF